MRTSRAAIVALGAAALLFASCGGGGSKFSLGPPLEGEPALIALPSGPQPAPGISVPDGFLAYEYASGLELPSVIGFDPLGRLFVAELRGRLSVIEDGDGDGLGDEPRPFWEDEDELYVSGLDVAPDGSAFISVRGRVLALRDNDGDGIAEERHTVIGPLPMGTHWNNGVRLGPDGKLYVANGSTCNLCPQEDELSAAILRANPDGSGLEVYASGLRNAFDFAFVDGEMWATENGIDFPREAEAPGYGTVLDAPDELNRVAEGGHYGWPDCVGTGIEIVEGGCEGKVDPMAEFDAYSSSDGITLYDREAFPEEYREDLFVAQFGSNLDSPRQAGRKIVRVELAPANGQPPRVSEFATGFEQPLDVAVDAAGTMFVTDMAAGKIYRIVWTGD
jgi:glucose/arabinose dehydrogenase